MQSKDSVVYNELYKASDDIHCAHIMQTKVMTSRNK